MGGVIPAARKEFLAGAVPVTLQGIGGPGAPHHFEFSRREDLGSLALLKKILEAPSCIL